MARNQFRFRTILSQTLPSLLLAIAILCPALMGNIANAQTNAAASRPQESGAHCASSTWSLVVENNPASVSQVQQLFLEAESGSLGQRRRLREFADLRPFQVTKLPLTSPEWTAFRFTPNACHSDLAVRAQQQALFFKRAAATPGVLLQCLPVSQASDEVSKAGQGCGPVPAARLSGSNN